MDFPGRLITEDVAGNQTAVQKMWTIDEIREVLLDGAIGMISLSWYYIAGVPYKASGLTIGRLYGVPETGPGDTVHMRTLFRRELLGEPYRNAGDPMDSVPVDILIDPAHIEYVSLVTQEATTEWCPHCDTEVELRASFQAQLCPNCKRKILPCTFCHDTRGEQPCDWCPLN